MNIAIIIKFLPVYQFVLSPSQIYCVFVACRQVFDNCETCRFLNENDTDSLACTACDPGYFFNYYGNCSGKWQYEIYMFTTSVSNTCAYKFVYTYYKVLII